MGTWTAGTERKKPSISARLVNKVESWLASRYPVPSKNAFLEGNFGPVQESGPHSNLPVQGYLPAALSGEYVKNTPNPFFTPRRGYHWFDGDGMLHGVHIKDGKATYVARLVKTNRLMQEVAHGRPMFVKFGDMEGMYGLLNILLIDPLRKLLGIISEKSGNGTANTALVFHGQRLLALHEGDHPYVIRVIQDGELETLGRWSYEGKLKHAFTAHPKVDAETGEMFCYGYNMEKAPYVTYRQVSREGKMGPPVPITIRKPTMMHDFAITERYAIFMDLPLFFEPKRILKGSVFKFDSTLPARFGVLPRSADSEAAIRWFDLPACFIFHTANAWEEEDDVVLYACRMPIVHLINVYDGEEPPPQLDDFLYEFRFNMKTGEASQREMANINCDFPRINEAFMGRKQRFVYAAHSQVLSVVGIIKFDLTGKPVTSGPEPPVGASGTAVAGYIPFGPGRTGGEPVFVPAGRDASEDDGYLLNFIYDSATDKSEMVVYDAKTMSPEPVASVQLPTRVPYGFHSIFVSEAQLQLQRTTLTSA